MKKWLFSPFTYIAGAKALFTGWAIMLVTALICSYSHTHFDGVIDAHTGRITPVFLYFTEPLIDWACLVLILYIACLVFSRSATRFIDVAGTIALARWPLLFYSFVGFGLNPPPGINEHADANTMLQGITGPFIFFSIIGMVFIIWMIALLYNAFSVSGNIKGGKATAVFIAGLIIAEVLSKIIFHQLYHHFI
jgi:hypothetical protein